MEGEKWLQIRLPAQKEVTYIKCLAVSQCQLMVVGWMYHSHEMLGDMQHRELSAIEYLKKSL
ncbi:MAG: hypothetical protein AAF607_14680, partial [Pseudomonadota bacterium]